MDATDCPLASPCEKPICDAGMCITKPLPLGTLCEGDSNKKCDGAGQCVDCIIDKDCSTVGDVACADNFFTEAASCVANTCVPGNTIDCTAANKICTPDGCVECITDFDCGLDPVGGCAHNTCLNSVCSVDKALQASPCPELGEGSCDGNGMCLPVKYVFVTSMEFNSNFGGTEGADLKCNDVATGAMLGGKWTSWTSDGNSQASTRFMPGQAPYVLLDGTKVFNSGMALLNANAFLVHGIDLDETLGLQQNVPVWTGTKPGGIVSLSCEGWTGGSPASPQGVVGQAGAMDATWTKWLNFMCNSMARLYCFQQ